MAKFSKRHYEAVALTLQDSHPGRQFSMFDDHMVATWSRSVAEFAKTFARDNGMFSTERFIRACQPGANVRARS